MARQVTIENVRSAIDNAIAKGAITVADIAAAMNMSERTFCRRMKDLTDITPRVFISRIRMDRCARLVLDFPNKPLKEIAPLCGFGEASGLSHAFRRAFGCYPTAYRERMLKKSDKT